VQSQRARLIARQPRREPLPRKVRAVAEGVAHRDITLLVHAGTRHPAEATVRRIRPLLRQLERPLRIGLELIPPHAAATRTRIHRVRRHDELLRSKIAINKSLHQLVSLRVKTHPSSRLRSTLRQLPVAKVVIRSHRNLLRPPPGANAPDASSR